MNPIDRNKIWKMVGILALITVVAGGLLRVSQHSSYTLGDYAADNPSLAYQTAEPSPTTEPTPAVDNSNANATENLQEGSSMAETTVLTGYSLNGELLTDQRTTLSDGFYYEPLSEKLQRYITGVSYPATVDNSDSSSETLLKSVEISYDDLRYVHIRHYNFEGNPAEGELICNKAIAQDLTEIFYELYCNEYQLEKVLLIDEYDVPIAKASNNGYYKEMLEVIKGMLSTALKDNSSLKFAVITGCLKIAKESIFTGTNNFVSDTISSTRYNEYYGFTQQDVDKLLEDAEIEEKADLIKEWYDGYNFGEFEVYCPWDVMNYLRDLQNDLNARPVSYWKNTSDNAIIRSFIDYTGAAIRKKLEVLIAGGSICQKIEEDLTYDYLHSSEDNVWSILYLTGYLTKVGERDKDGQIELRIPNKEVKEIFESTVRKWFEDSARVTNRKDLFDAVWNKDADKATKEISTLLRMTISYYDYRENFYHAFLAGIFAGAGYSVESNREHGEGRSDIVIYNDVTGQVAVFEAKYSRKLEDLEKDCQKALDQINTKMYAKEFEDAYEEVLCYGIAFYKKRCLVKSK